MTEKGSEGLNTASAVDKLIQVREMPKYRTTSGLNTASAVDKLIRYQNENYFYDIIRRSQYRFRSRQVDQLYSQNVRNICEKQYV